MKNIIILLLLTLLIGCNNTSENDSGKFNSIETEKNLKQSLQTYLDLKLNNQIVESSKYMHPISWQIIKLKFPDVTNLSSLKQKFDSMYVKFSIAKMNKEYNISYKVGNIIDTTKIVLLGNLSEFMRSIYHKLNYFSVIFIRPLLLSEFFILLALV
jgi:hypothetical protein